MGMKKVTRQELQRQIKELKSQLASTYHFADVELHKASTDHCMGGGVILELTATGGRKIINPVCITDGLSDETLQAIRADLIRSYKHAIEFKPKGVANETE